ncbi:hypothetical protein [Nonomuraea rhodomycinica]|uniref:Uncharacterized protein n=1 Tax=Nonomuraea rhodomycinica TaxID=1712872 RepID=A0A7Y6MFW0_9ACTN|nr:hypothetical protein [Nonomuraea rhodomycinica]NUW46367.1 hypothetical protein [Nonomuraea rhodomycinica]
MARTRATAVSAMVLSLGLTGIGAAPFVVQSASASVVAYDPNVDPCDTDQACESTPEVTVTVTTTLPTPEEEPETTITRTVTKSPPATKTARPTPKKSTTSTAPTPPPSTATQNPLPVEPPQTSAEPPSIPQATEPTEEESVVMPSVAGTDPPSQAPTTPTATPQDTTTSESVQLEVRAATPEFDQAEMAQKLSIPALVMVLLVLFAVLIFEGRLRRMAHAAAVRRAGPPRPDLGAPGYPTVPGYPPGGPGHPAGGYPAGAGYPAGPGGYAAGPGYPTGAPGYPTAPAGYPAGPGYASTGMPPGYPATTAYAPILSFVPVQAYPGGPVQYGAVYPDPATYEESGLPVLPPPGQTGPDPAPEPVVLHPDDYSNEPVREEPQATYRAPFEPAVPPEQPPADIPAGGAAPYAGPPEHPASPATGAETGDATLIDYLPGQEPDGGRHRRTR